MAKSKRTIKSRTKTRKNKKATRQTSAPASQINVAFEAIYTAVARIPRGKVSTYGAIAQVAGLPRRARLVGTALKNVPSERGLPWHRVITASGRLAFPEGSDAFALQSSRLAREGVTVEGRRISLSRYGWPRENKSLDELLWGGE